MIKKILTIIITLFFITIVVGCENTPIKPTDDEIRINNVIELIEKIPNNITLASERVIQKANDAYNTLNSENKSKVTNYNILDDAINKLNTLKENKKKQEEVDNVIYQISILPTIRVTLEDKESIENAWKLYNALDDEQKNQVTNFEKLESAQNKLSVLLEEKRLNDEVSKLDEDILALYISTDLKQEDAQNLRNRYNNLPDEYKEKVKNYDKLQQIESDILKNEEIKKYKALASEFDKKVIALPLAEDITLSDESKIVNLRNEYNSLEENIKKYITKLNDLEEKENKIVELKKIEKAKNDAKLVDEKIELLPSIDNLKVSDEEKVKFARTSYNNLSNIAKTYVTKYDNLIKLENKLTELKQIEKEKNEALNVDNMISNLPSINDLTLEDEYNVKLARASYNNLSASAATYVTKLDELTKLEEKLEQLKQVIVDVDEFTVKYYLDGGILDGVTIPSVSLEKTTFTTNFYSTGYWGNYKTAIVLFKGSLIPSTDKYTSAYKVGFSFDQTKSKYIVDQIIENGKELTTALNTSTYYIFVHPDYSEGYEKIATISLNDEIDISTSLPDTLTTSFDGVVKVYSESSTQAADYSICTYTKVTILNTPTKEGYSFTGWFTNKYCTGEKVTTVSKDITVYAGWKIYQQEIDPNDILSYVSNIASSNTVDNLPLSDDVASYVWSSSNNNLYNINNGIATVNKSYQTHKKQKVTVSVKITYKDSKTETKSKEITINPVLFEELKDTPVATYFSTGAMYAYKAYNSRYIKEKTIFSNSTRKVLDILYYAFIYIKEDGSCYLGDTSYLSEVKELKNHNVRIVASISGTSVQASTIFKNLTADDTKRKVFVNNLMDLVEKYNFDGLDVDWETASSSAPVVASGMNALCKDLRNEMTKRQAEGGTPYLLTAAVPSSSWGLSKDRFDLPTLNKYLDYINIMSYDMNNGSKGSHLSPLYVSSYDGGYGFGASWGVEKMVSLGFSRSKLIIGSAGYGKAYRISGTSSNASYPGLGASGSLTQIAGVDGSFASGTLFGNAIVSLINSGKYKKYIEYNKSGKLVGSFLYNETDKIFVTYDSDEVILAKYEYASSMKGVGIMCWCYSEDTADIYVNTIYKAVYK